MADNVLKYKYIVKNVARKHGKTATFMPKPIFMDNGSGMHVHTSLWKDGKNLFAGSGYAGLSDMAMYAIGGLLRHAPALCAFTNPTTNSYKRLVPGYEAPVNLAYSRRNRSAAIRIPVYSPSHKAKRLEFRCPTAPAIRTSPSPPCSWPCSTASRTRSARRAARQGHLRPRTRRNWPRCPRRPRSLEEALTCLEKDHEFLLQGDVFTRRRHRHLDLVQTRKGSRSHPAAAASL